MGVRQNSTKTTKKNVKTKTNKRGFSKSKFKKLIQVWKT